MPVFINPGTEPCAEGFSQENADKGLAYFLEDLKLNDVKTKCHGFESDDGWCTYELLLGDRRTIVCIPGTDPDVTRKSEPWVSKRLYVDGSSWLWGYALEFAHDFLTGADDEE